MTNDARVPVARLLAFDAAAAVQLKQLRRFWTVRRHLTLIIVQPGDSRLLTDGQHTLTADGMPVAYVAYGRGWTRAASHELLEEAVNPAAATVVGGLYVEVCDPVNRLSYRIRGVRMQDFVTPRWFVAGGAGRLDFLRRVHRPQDFRFGYVYRSSPAGQASMLFGHTQTRSASVASGAG